MNIAHRNNLIFFLSDTTHLLSPYLCKRGTLVTNLVTCNRKNRREMRLSRPFEELLSRLALLTKYAAIILHIFYG